MWPWETLFFKGNFLRNKMWPSCNTSVTVVYLSFVIQVYWYGENDNVPQVVQWNITRILLPTHGHKSCYNFISLFPRGNNVYIHVLHGHTVTFLYNNIIITFKYKMWPCDREKPCFSRGIFLETRCDRRVTRPWPWSIFHLSYNAHLLNAIFTRSLSIITCMLIDIVKFLTSI